MGMMRRIGWVLLGLLLIFGLGLLLLQPQMLVLIGERLGTVATGVRLILLLLASLVVLVIVYRQASRPGPGQRSGLSVRARGVHVDVNPETAREQVGAAVDAVSGVTKVDVNLVNMRGRAALTLNVTVDETVTNLPDKQRALMREVERVLTKQLGVRLAGPPNIYLTIAHKQSQTAAEPTRPPLGSVAQSDQPD